MLTVQTAIEIDVKAIDVTLSILGLIFKSESPGGRNR